MSIAVREDSRNGNLSAESTRTHHHTPSKRPYDSLEARTKSTSDAEGLRAGPSNYDMEREVAEQSEAAEALTRLSTLSEESEESTDQTYPTTRRRTAKRVRFAEGPLKGGPANRVTPDGHPKLEGAVATRRRVGSYSTTVTEPITKYSIQLLEAELGAAENGPSISRLKRRFGLAPPTQRYLPYVSPGNAKQPPAESRARAPLFGRVVDVRARKNPQQKTGPIRGPGQQRGHTATPEGQQRSASRLLDLLKPLEGIASSGSSAVLQCG